MQLGALPGLQYSSGRGFCQRRCRCDPFCLHLAFVLGRVGVYSLGFLPAGSVILHVFLHQARLPCGFFRPPILHATVSLAWSEGLPQISVTLKERLKDLSVALGCLPFLVLILTGVMMLLWQFPTLRTFLATPRRIGGLFGKSLCSRAAFVRGPSRWEARPSLQPGGH